MSGTTKKRRVTSVTTSHPSNSNVSRMKTRSCTKRAADARFLLGLELVFYKGFNSIWDICRFITLVNRTFHKAVESSYKGVQSCWNESIYLPKMKPNILSSIIKNRLSPFIESLELDTISTNSLNAIAKHLKKLKYLKIDHFGDPVKAETLCNTIATLTTLDEIRLHCFPFSRELVNSLCLLKNLKMLHLQFPKMSESDKELLTKKMQQQMKKKQKQSPTKTRKTKKKTTKQKPK